jgi:hypothetical protein
MTSTPDIPVSKPVALRVAWEHIQMLPGIWRGVAAQLRSEPTDPFAKGQASGLRIAADQLASDLLRLKAAISCAHSVLPCDTCSEGCW